MKGSGRTYRFLPLFILTALLLAGGCARQGYRDSTDLVLGDCGGLWQQYVEQVRVENAFDAQAWPLPSYPFLRVNRNLAYAAHGPLSPQQRRDWLGRAYRLGRLARQAESARFSPTVDLPELESCLRRNLPALVDDSAFWAYVRQHRPPDAYNDTARVLGLYPLQQPVVSWQVENLVRDVEAEFQHYISTAQWRRYQIASRPDWNSIRELFQAGKHRDALGMPVFSPAEEALLFAYYSPVIEQEQRFPTDRIGAPVRSGTQWRVTEEPRLFTLLSETRWRGQWLPQLVFVWWYSARPKSHMLDMYAGQLDSLVFRLTLDWRGEVLFYDSIHSCGCYQKWYPARAGIRFKGLDGRDEPLAILPVRPPTQPYQAVIRLKSPEHFVVGMDFEKSGTRQVARLYDMRPYLTLRRQPSGEKYLFAPDGLVPGTERPERFLLWGLGVPSAGAMRQWGHHATAFAGRRHFDDPLLFERYFEWAPPD